MLQVGLLDRLTRIVPEGLSSFFFASSGSEVVDNAVKLARAATKRPNIICFEVGRASIAEPRMPRAIARNTAI